MYLINIQHVAISDKFLVWSNIEITSIIISVSLVNRLLKVIDIYQQEKNRNSVIIL